MGEQYKMLNDKDDKFDGQEESEYHYSDEDVSYEVEPESPKSEPAVQESGGSRASILNKLSQSKRMLISGAVFLLLIFVVYKMVTPTAQAPQTEITASAPRPASMPAAPQQASLQPPAPQPPAQVGQALPALQQGMQPTAATVPQPASTGLPPPGTQMTALQQPTPTPVGAAAQAVPQSPMAPAGLPQPGSSTQVIGTQAGMTQAATQPALTAQPLAAQQAVSQSAAPSPAGMPAVIPVQSPIPTTIAETNAIPLTTGMQPIPSGLPEGAEAKIANLQADSEKLMTQLQADYTQKLSEYAAQNKALQDQMQLLSARMAGMESQLSQLLQALARQMQGGGSAPSRTAPPEPQTTAIEQKLSYNVQAIIPGRAWLKSDNGETLTVAEGDVVRDLGRINKIDPYDGVVEINTGSKVVSFSY